MDARLTIQMDYQDWTRTASAPGVVAKSASDIRRDGRHALQFDGQSKSWAGTPEAWERFADAMEAAREEQLSRGTPGSRAYAARREHAARLGRVEAGIRHQLEALEAMRALGEGLVAMARPEAEIQPEPAEQIRAARAAASAGVDLEEELGWEAITTGRHPAGMLRVHRVSGLDGHEECVSIASAQSGWAFVVPAHLRGAARIVVM